MTSLYDDMDATINAALDDANPFGTAEDRAFRAGRRDAKAGRGASISGPANIVAAYLAGVRSAG